MAFDRFLLTDRPANAPQPPRGAPVRQPRTGVAARPQLRRPRSVRRDSRLEALHREADVLTHDLNNLLNVILAANEALAQALPEGSERRELAEISQDAAERSAELVGRLRDLTAPQPAARMACDAGAAAQTVARLARLSIPSAVNIRSDLADAALGCAADRAGLDAALLNLCVNAGHAMPLGGVLSLSASAADGLVVLQVSDTGYGMSPEVLARATEPYFTTRKGRGGTGLGLAGVFAFAARCGGRLELASREGFGTTATLYLPSA